MRQARRRRLVFWLFGFALSLGATLALAEVVLWFFPVESSLRTVAVNAENPVFHAKPDLRYTFSRNWDFKIPNTGRVNNVGFINDQDYTVAGPRPLIAVIGDSYIEAKMVRFAETLHGRLAVTLADRGRAYSFAFSGAPLSQYVVWARHAWDTYHPDAFIISVINNDFDESLARYHQGPGFHHYVEGPDGRLELKLVSFRRSSLMRIVVHSALARYLVFHLQVLEAWKSVTAWFSELMAAHAGPAAPSAVDAEREALSLRAIAAFLRDLDRSVGLPHDRVLFIVDGFRSAIHQPGPPAAEQSGFFAVMRRALMDEAAARGYAVLDLHPVFVADFARNRTRFDYDFDYHWNAYGHGVIAAAVMESEWWRRVVGR